MQRKLITALVAGALELYAASVSAQALTGPSYQCTTPFATGPLNAESGYTETITDIHGTTLQICKDANFCFFDPLVENNLVSEQTGTGGESFWWLADTTLTDNSGLDAVLVMAAEATYNVEEPAANQQLSFTRLRIRIDAPAVGLYQVDYPFGRETYRVDALDAGDEVREVFDISFVPEQVGATGRATTWLRWTGNDAPAGFIGDGATPHAVTGSPCGQNYFRITARNFDGTPLNVFTGANGQPTNIAQTTLFTVNGQLATAGHHTPVASDRVSYARAAGGSTQIDAFATSGVASSVVLGDFETRAVPATTAARPVLGGATVALQHAATDFSISQGVGVPAAELPIAMTLTATGGSSNVATGVATTETRTNQATRLVRALTDSVVISKAEFDPVRKVLVVEASSSDKAANPVLTLDGYTAAVGSEIPTQVPPGSVTVVSAKGGSDTALVRVASIAPPFVLNAPTNMSVAAFVNNQGTTAPGRATARWTDASDGEASYLLSYAPQRASFGSGVLVDAATPVSQPLNNMVLGTQASFTTPAGTHDANTVYRFSAQAIGPAAENGPASTVYYNRLTGIQLPGAGTAVTATTGTVQTLTIVPPTNATAAFLTGFKIERCAGNATTCSATAGTWTTLNVAVTPQVGTSNYQASITGLTRNTQYRYRVSSVSNVPALFATPLGSDPRYTAVARTLNTAN